MVSAIYLKAIAARAPKSDRLLAVHTRYIASSLSRPKPDRLLGNKQP